MEHHNISDLHHKYLDLLLKSYLLPYIYVNYYTSQSSSGILCVTSAFLRAEGE